MAAIILSVSFVHLRDAWRTAVQQWM